MGNANGGRPPPTNSDFGIPPSRNSSENNNTTVVERREPKLPAVDLDICANGNAGFKLSDIYELESPPIGKGGFGSVYKGNHNRIGAASRRAFAVKVIHKTKMSYNGHQQRRCVRNYKDLVRFCSEVQILERLRTEPPVILPVVYLYEVFLSSSSIHLVTDRLVEELGKWRNEMTDCTEKMAINVCRTILDALAFMHDRGVVYRDLKMNNVMFKVKDDPRSLKIVDMGLARILKKGESVTPTLPDGQRTRDFFCGTPGHIPPEMYLGKPYRFEVDLFSFGVTVFRLLSGKHPFLGKDLKVLQHRTMELQYSVEDKDWEGRSEASKDFVHKLIARKEDRMTIEEAKAHPWFREAGQSVLPPDFSYGGATNALGT